MKALGIIAGEGAFPLLLARRLQEEGRPFVVLSYGQDHQEATWSAPHLSLSLGQVGKALAFLRQHHVTQVVMAGAFQRPSLSSLRVDWQGSRWLGALMKQPKGDDHWLRFLATQLAKEGMEVVSPQSILPHTLPGAGAFSDHVPTREDQGHIRKGLDVLDALSPFDVGQALVTELGWVVGIEAAEGTDGLIQRTQPLMREHKKAFLIKSAKKTQDVRLDPPVVGIQTLRFLLDCGFAGLAFRAKQIIFLEPAPMKAFADREGLIMWGV
ncbi:LpxI family protein [bacterium NHP-B]|nr:LpxI family protein [bacterium NHP-B]